MRSTTAFFSGTKNLPVVKYLTLHFGISPTLLANFHKLYHESKNVLGK